MDMGTRLQTATLCFDEALTQIMKTHIKADIIFRVPNLSILLTPPCSAAAFDTAHNYNGIPLDPLVFLPSSQDATAGHISSATSSVFSNISRHGFFSASSWQGCLSAKTIH